MGRNTLEPWQIVAIEMFDYSSLTDEAHGIFYEPDGRQYWFTKTGKKTYKKPKSS
jgi:hypothetical protein